MVLALKSVALVLDVGGGDSAATVEDDASGWERVAGTPELLAPLFGSPGSRSVPFLRFLKSKLIRGARCLFRNSVTQVCGRERD